MHNTRPTIYNSLNKQLENSHPGEFSITMPSFVSLTRSNYGIEQAVDLAGEQTYRRNAKTTGMLVH